MKKIFLTSFLVSLLFIFAGTGMAQEDIQKSPACIYCGMDRAKFSHSRMYVTYEDNTSVGTCSIHCLAIDLATNIDKTPVSIKVGDYTQKNLIEAEEAFWVIDDNKPGVMTKQAKWAFAEKSAAEQYIKENGGVIATFDETMKAAYESMYQDVKMIREKRKMMKAKKMDS